MGAAAAAAINLCCCLMHPALHVGKQQLVDQPEVDRWVGGWVRTKQGVQTEKEESCNGFAARLAEQHLAAALVASATAATRQKGEREREQ
jgi:hypothetical protein